MTYPDDALTDAEVSRMFRERIAARLANLAPAEDVAATPSSPPAAPAPAGASTCTGGARTPDASGQRDAASSPRSAPSAPVSPHVGRDTGGAGTYPTIEQGDAAHRSPTRNAERPSKPFGGVHAMGSARGASAAEPAHGRPPARSLPHPDDGTCWGEPAPASRRLPPLAYLALLLAASWLALLALAAVEAARALFLRP